MKVSLWLFALALAIVCVTSWVISHLLVEAWHQKFASVPIPEFTRLILLSNG
jgi:hypothetical protein